MYRIVLFQDAPEVLPRPVWKGPPGCRFDVALFHSGNHYDGIQKFIASSNCRGSTASIVNVRIRMMSSIRFIAKHDVLNVQKVLFILNIIAEYFI